MRTSRKKCGDFDGGGAAGRETRRGKTRMHKHLKRAVSALALTMALGMAGEAMATEGYFQHAYGLRHKALAGAGAASAEDATAISLNPAGLVDVGNQFNMGISAFMPVRGTTLSGIVTPPSAAGFTGKYKSKRPLFFVPTLAYSRQLDADSAIAFSIFGNGGMNTTYKATAGSGGVGLFGGGKAGVDLMQMFISAAYARRFGDNFSIGIAPVFAIQRFKAYGIGGFASVSVDGTKLSNNGYSYSYGAGVRVGMTFKPTERLSFGASYQTKTWMTKFKKYSGLFAEGGDFDIPANLQVGLAYDVTDDLKVMLDYRHIFYSDVKAIANPGICTTASTYLGASNGCGFGWADTNTIKIGLEYQASNDLILRAGYAYTFPNPVGKDDVTFNTLAPGVVRHEITAGATYRYNANNDFDFAMMFAPKTSVKGPEVHPGSGLPTGNSVDDHMYQLEFSVGWTYNFGGGSSRAR